MLVLEYLVAERAVPRYRTTMRAELASLSESEVEQLAALGAHGDPARAAQRLRRGEHCAVARRDGRVVAAIWSATGSAYVPYLDATLELDARDVFHHDLYIAPECRSRGLMLALVAHAVRDRRAEGFTRSLGLVAVENVAAWRVYRRAGIEPIGQVSCLRLGVIRRLSCRALAGAPSAALPRLRVGGDA
jgi:GNAT superfamily N-acetyltransferase